MAGRKKKRERVYRHPEDFKAQVVAEYMDGATAADLEAKHDISRTLVHRWSRQAGHSKKRKPNGSAGIPQIPKSPARYDDQTKAIAVRRLDAGENATEIAAELGCNPGSIYAWKQKAMGLGQRKRPKAKSKPRPASVLDRIEDLEAQVEDLRFQLGLDG